MNNFSFGDLCCLFCFPPCPSSIAAKLAFLPPKPSYTLKPENGSDNGRLQLRLNYCPANGTAPASLGEAFYVTTRRKNRIVCLYIKAQVVDPKFTILYSHGNAVDLGQMYSFFSMLSACLNCDIFSYDYSGYGRSSGRPNEQNLYADAEAAWNSLRNLYCVPAERIIIYGQSIGSVPSIELASKFKCAGVVLHSPMVSGVRVACPSLTSVPWCCDVFQSTHKVSKIKSYTLVIHGVNDEIVDVSHGVTIFERLKFPAEPLWVEGAGHNDIEMFDQYFERIRRFVFSECTEQIQKEKGEDAPNGNC